MELNLKTIPIKDMAVLAKVTLPSEESSDIVVPDSLPDIIRIVETDARMELRSKEVRGNKLYVEASVPVSVIYVPENGSGLCRLAITLPVSVVFDLEGMIGSDVQIVLDTDCLKANARELNPRKIAVRVTANFHCTVYTVRETHVCTAIDGDGVETLMTTHTVRLIDGIYEKNIGVTDSVELPQGVTASAEILKLESSIRTLEKKQIKNKVVLKGEMQVSMLFLEGEEQGRLKTADVVIPFAGVVDCIGVDEDSTTELSYTLGGADWKIVRESGTDRSLLTAKLELQTLILAWSERELTCVADAYGTVQSLVCENEEICFVRAGGGTEIQQTLRETISCGVPIRQIYLCTIRTENPTVQNSENGVEVFVDGIVHLILEAEDGGIYALTKSMVLSAPLENSDLVLQVAEISDKSYHINGGDTVEVRCRVTYRLQPNAGETICQIRRADLLPIAPAPTRTPALTLCYANEGETLWDLGKRLGAAINDIRSANALSGDDLPQGRILLIPRTARESGRM